MKAVNNEKGFFKYLSYENEHRWLTIFIHFGFVVALLLGLAALILPFFS